MIVLGINAYHGDVSAALLRDGELVAAVEEERFTRIKHAAGFPVNAIAACLSIGGVVPAEIEHVAISRDPRANLLRKAWFALRNRPGTRAGERWRRSPTERQLRAAADAPRDERDAYGSFPIAGLDMAPR